VQRFSDNVQGAIFMVISMFGYVVNDTFIKLAVADLNLYQAIFLRGVVMSVIVLFMLRGKASLRDIRRHASAALVIRVGAEVLGTVAFLNALVNMPIANVTALFQVVPLAVTLAAALVLGEKVGWRRYVAIVLGFVGVIIVVQPTSGGFDKFALLALGAVLMTTIRDLATTKLAPEVPSALVTLLTAISIALMGLGASFIDGWVAMNARSLGAVAGAAAFLTMGYLFSIKTVRVGELSFSAPFRYSILVWAIVLGIVVFGEVPDTPTIVGSVLIVAMGLYSVARERRLGVKPIRRVFKNRPGV
jgi:drug/metabolite transporter (DMT)-like permease